jgi:hypothetical protein
MMWTLNQKVYDEDRAINNLKYEISNVLRETGNFLIGMRSANDEIETVSSANPSSCAHQEESDAIRDEVSRISSILDKVRQ